MRDDDRSTRTPASRSVACWAAAFPADDVTGAPRRHVLAGLGATLLGATGARAAAAPAGRHFTFAAPQHPEGFMLDGQPFQVRSGEMHPARIPKEYWRHRIRMAKAMGLNTIAIYVMWNHHEREPGRFDFSSDNRDIAAFLRLCADEGLLVFLRPGPYVCAEWELGGIPAYLLRNPDAHLRQRVDTAFMAASARYVARLARIVRPLMVDRGGPVAMIQVENEYASFGRDLVYLEQVRDMWKNAGIDGPFVIADGLTQLLAARTYLPGAAIGLNGDTNFAAARQIDATAPVWVTEGYAGWLTHWGDKAFASADYTATLKMLMAARRSFNIYVVHGGTSFGQTAGSNANDDGSKFEPSITSYDYGAPINECGIATPQYLRMRSVIHDAVGRAPPPVPPAPTLIDIPAVRTRPSGALFATLPRGVAIERPAPMELALGQTEGMILYRHMLPADAAGALAIDGLHDEALVLLDAQPIGALSRVAAANRPGPVNIPAGAGGVGRVLDVLVFPFGRVNYGHYMRDRKGVLGDITLAGKPLTGWTAHGLPLDGAHLDRMRRSGAGRTDLLHEATFDLDAVGDTFIDMSGWKLGFVWVNGRMLGRHCALGPQTRLYCPAPWLRRGTNVVTILDLYAAPGGTISGTRRSDTMLRDAAIGKAQ